MEIGDLLQVNRGLYIHEGVFAGYQNGIPYVLTNTLERGESLYSLKEFSNGLQVQIQSSHHLNRFAIQERIQKVLLNPQPYNLLLRNCEHTVNLVLFGEAKSTQVRAWTAIAGIAVIAGLIIGGKGSA